MTQPENICPQVEHVPLHRKIESISVFLGSWVPDAPTDGKVFSPLPSTAVAVVSRRWGCRRSLPPSSCSPPREGLDRAWSGSYFFAAAAHVAAAGTTTPLGRARPLVLEWGLTTLALSMTVRRCPSLLGAAASIPKQILF
ncbi:hypothetical protein PVAP13_5KG361807 [Panicum virgatum]|uniref:Uncharacterized protein n=1 Tax=Panicum virgatum TaxID=38727 RepID=A0A8T0SPS0_PANVG|nr:hypothetical protein PVAP13_5KG361807 [Panicum virgatum]